VQNGLNMHCLRVEKDEQRPNWPKIKFKKSNVARNVIEKRLKCFKNHPLGTETK
jgi:hypothetical protein